MKEKQRKSKRGSSNNKKTGHKQENPVNKASRSSGWFTKEDAKKITKEVIGRFHNI